MNNIVRDGSRMLVVEDAKYLPNCKEYFYIIVCYLAVADSVPDLVLPNPISFLPPCVHLDSFNLLLPHSGIRIFLSSHSNQGRRVLSYFRGKENDFRQAFLFSHGNIFRRSSGSGRTYYLRQRRRVGEAGFKEKFTTLSERK